MVKEGRKERRGRNSSSSGVLGPRQSASTDRKQTNEQEKKTRDHQKEISSSSSTTLRDDAVGAVLETLLQAKLQFGVGDGALARVHRV